LALWEGLQLLPTLTNGFVLAAVPAFVARTATVISLGCGAGLLLLGFRLAGRDGPREEGDGRDEELEPEDPRWWETHA